MRIISKAYAQRHPVDKKIAETVFRHDAANLSTSLGWLLSNVDGAESLAGDMKSIVGNGLVVEPTSPMIPRCLRILGQAYRIMFRAAAGGPPPHSCRLDDKEITVFQGKVDESYVHPGNWCTGFFANLLTRQYDELKCMCDFRVELLRRSSSMAPAFVTVHHSETGAAECVWS